MSPFPPPSDVDNRETFAQASSFVASSASGTVRPGDACAGLHQDGEATEATGFSSVAIYIDTLEMLVFIAEICGFGRVPCSLKLPIRLFF